MAPIALSTPEPPHLSIEPKSVKSVKHDFISDSEQPVSIDDFLPLEGKTSTISGVSEILCTAFGLALRCYSTESVKFEYHDETATGSRSTTILFDVDEFLKVEDLLEAVRTTLQLPQSMLEAQDAKPDAQPYQTFRSAIILREELVAGRPISPSPELDLELHAINTKNGIDIHMLYTPSTVTENLAVHLADTLRQTFELVNNHPDTDLASATYLGPLSQKEILDWNSNSPSPVIECAHELVRQRASLQPQASAIDSWDAQMTYAELDSLSDRLATVLVELGVKAEAIVPLCFEKTAWYVVAMLAVLKAGGAFVPLDPTHPPSRLREIVSQVDAPMVLTTAKYHDLFEDFSVKAIIVNEQTVMTSGDRCLAPVAVTPQNLAYVIFTSGSTGKPKGTMIEHQSFCSGSLRQGEAANMGPHSRIFQFASYSFDVSILEILTGLIFGACICIPNEQLGRADFVQSMNDFRVNWAFLTPSVLKVLTPDQLPLLRTLVLGGEAMSESDMMTWAGRLQLMNGYGPSECSVAATANTQLNPQSSPRNIGRAIGGVCWIVDPQNHNVLLPVGATGELIIQGPIVSRGYLKDPVKTSAAFFQSPAWMTPGTSQIWNRFYKTGDLVRYDADGMIHFIGRKDHQVKLHGQRMELGEVEHHLWTDTLIRNGMALVPYTGLCKSRLVGVVSLHKQYTTASVQTHPSIRLIDHAEAAEETQAIAKRLSRLLPSYMVPTVWIALESLPLMSSGKMDRKKVAEFVADISTEAFQHIMGNSDKPDNKESMSNTETLVQKVWSKILNIPEEQIGKYSNFLSVGGDSIKAMAVMSEFRKLGVTVLVADLLRHNVSEIASKIEESGSAHVLLGSKADHLPTSHLQRTFLEASRSGNSAIHHAILLKLNHKVSIQQLGNALESITSSYPALTLRFEEQNGEWFQAFKDHDELETPVYHLNLNHISSLEEAKEIVQRRQTCLGINGNPNFMIDLFSLRGIQHISLVIHAATLDSQSLSTVIGHLDYLLQSDDDKTKHVWESKLWSRDDFSHAWLDHLRSERGTKAIASSLQTFTTATVSGDREYVTETLELDCEITGLLTGPCNEKYGTNTPDLLLAALIPSYYQIFKEQGQPSQAIVESSARESTLSKDLRGLVGQFSSMQSVHVPVEHSDQITLQLIREIKDNMRRRDESSTLGSSNIIFTYGLRGQIIDGTVLKQITPDGRHGLGDIVDTLIEVSCLLEAGQFRITVGSAQVSAQKLSLFVDQYRRNIAQAVEILAPNTVREFTLADIPLLALDYTSIDRVNRHHLPRLGLRSHQIEDIYPCSPLQQGLLMSQARKQGSYNVSIGWEVTSRETDETIDIGRLLSSWQKVVDYHPALRTIFTEDFGGKEPYAQIVLRRPRAEVSVTPCSDVDVGSVLEETIDLSTNPVVPPHRFSINFTADGSVLCRVDASHTIVDGVSKSLILRDLKRAYAGTLIRPNGGAKYRDFVQYVAANDMSASITFWKDHLAEVEPCYFPSLAEAQGTHELKYAEVALEVPASILRDFCVSHSITISNLVQTVWALVCRVYVGRDDICFGYLASGRDAPVEDLVNMVGPTISVLICKALLDDSTIVKDALKACQKEFLDSLAHQHCSLAEIQHALGLAGMPLFNTGISFQTMTDVDSDETVTDIDFKGLVVREPTEYNITVHVIDSPNNLDIKLGYWTDSISESQAQSISGTFSAILKSVVENPEARVDQLSVIGRYDLSQIASWNQNVPETASSTVPYLVLQQTMRTPHAIAIDTLAEKITYERFGRMWLSLSQYLTTLGIGVGDYVPLTFEKSAWAIVAMLAVLGTGAAFVPLDPKTPVERLREVSIQTAANVVLTSPKYASNWSNLVPTIVSVDQALLDKLKHEGDDLHQGVVRARPHDDAYVIFTSGSTGKPKGCVVQHAAFCSGALAQGKLACLGPSSRVLQFASYSFDVSLLEIMTSLMFGACICVPDEDLSKDIKHCINVLNINWTFLTPSVLKLLQPSDVPSLKTLILGGEALSKGDILNWADRVQLYNGYGPSECSVAAAANPGLQPTTDPANIGHAVGGVLWVVDAKQPSKLLPIGAVGELLISGPILARGYLGDPEKTAAAFVEQKSFVPGSWERERYYRTGDLVRYNADGTIHFIGRADGQVKIRGQRVELGEIEYNVERDENIRHALTLLPSQGPFKKQLLAVVSFKGFDLPVEDERLSLVPENRRPEVMAVVTRIANTISAALPVYMVPALWVPVNAIPLLPSGKLDRKKVRRWVETLDNATYEQIANIGAKASGRGPSTPAEFELRRIWASVLNRPEENISMERSFQSLGGDSISAMQVIAQCRDVKLSLAVKDLIQCPTIAELALRVRALDESAEPMEDDVGVPFNLSPQQTWEFDLKQHCDLNRYNTTFLLSVHSDSDLEPVVNATVERHPMLRARFQRDDSGRWMQYIPLDRSNSHMYQEMEVPDLKAIEPYTAPNQSGFDLQRGPLMRAIVFKLPNGDRYVGLTVHHMIIDTVSWRILLQDIQQGLSTGAITSHRSDSFALWCRKLKEHADEIWTPEYVLPFSVPAPLYDYWQMEETMNLFVTETIQEFSLDTNTTSRLMGKCNHQYQTKPLDIFLSAIFHAFSATFADRPVPAVFIYSHGRDEFGGELDVSNTIGWFTSSTPVVIKPSGDIVDDLQAVRDVRASVPGNGVPYWATRWLTEDGHAAFEHHSPFELSMNYLGQYQQLERDDSVLRYVDVNKPKATGSGSGLLRTALVETQAIVIGDSLQIKFVYNTRMARQKQLLEWQARVKESLMEIANRLGDGIE
ncbi:non-ribosomal peptide synthetase [Aspergillus luchuensis]|uniref:Non-ribosomal peptide synthetase n=1 Tax=Aspergillus kawachii TaxID=1069201 RepID=A0A146F344_ASPKA|nr:non-ribosomal peptide synthetase [Aspergillus luchuensis]BCR98463.1 non-ribosomal peptide synthetase [Aspergillus luchuensis]BCS10802.1 non-ribosomal peptide synthetase [Aspergillus luchuensis]GAA90188.1 nonribosomal peptide synthase [Aspergillus luchuensis IFO 4308]GAT20694.1 nonribosomal peptide synthase [Aspergillus luchuensis]